MIAHRPGGPRRRRFADYARRRFIRLYPAYWVALTALAILPGLDGAFSAHWWAFYGLVDFFTQPPPQRLPAARTVRAGCRSRGRWRRHHLLHIPAVLRCGDRAADAAVAQLLGALGADRDRDPRPRLALPRRPAGRPARARLVPLQRAGHLYWFSLGLALAAISTLDWRGGLARWGSAPSPTGRFSAGAGRRRSTPSPSSSIYPAPFIIAPFLVADEYDTLNLLQGVAAILLFVPGTFGNPNRGLPNRILGSPFLMRVGLISYGLLLWNVTIAVLIGDGGAEKGFWTVLIGGGLATIPLAVGSYLLIERPLMKFKYQPFGFFRRHRGGPAKEAG